MQPSFVRGPNESYQDLVAFLNWLNADWVKAMRRFSPRLLIEFLLTKVGLIAAAGLLAEQPHLDPEARLGRHGSYLPGPCAATESSSPAASVNVASVIEI